MKNHEHRPIVELLLISLAEECAEVIGAFFQSEATDEAVAAELHDLQSVLAILKQMAVVPWLRGSWFVEAKAASILDTSDGSPEPVKTLIPACSNLIQRVSKVLRFGWDDIEPGQELTNHRRFVLACHDVQAVLALLKQAGRLPWTDPKVEVAAKIAKLHQWAGTARLQGYGVDDVMRQDGPRKSLWVAQDQTIHGDDIEGIPYIELADGADWSTSSYPEGRQAIHGVKDHEFMWHILRYFPTAVFDGEGWPIAERES